MPKPILFDRTNDHVYLIADGALRQLTNGTTPEGANDVFISYDNVPPIAVTVGYRNEVSVSGDTYEHRGALKAMQFQWDAERKSWRARFNATPAKTLAKLAEMGAALHYSPRSARRAAESLKMWHGPVVIDCAENDDDARRIAETYGWEAS